jgi:lipopolysaccharide export system permease protein
MFSSIDKYLARLIVVPMLVTLFGSALLLVLDRMRRLFSFITEQGGPVNVVWHMLADLIPEYLGLGIPLGVAVGILLAFRKLAASSELDVMFGTGMSYGRLLRVPYLIAIGMAILNFGIVGFVQPIARYGYEDLRYELVKGAFGASIKVGEFAKFGKDMALRIDSSVNNGQDLSGIFVQMNEEKGQSLSVTAEHGKFLSTDDKHTIIFRLHNGVLVHNSPAFKTPRILTFASHDLPLPVPEIEPFRERGGPKYEKTLPQLLQAAFDPKAKPSERNTMLANFYFRMAIVVMMLLLPLFSMALAVPPKRSSSSVGVYLAVIIIVVYYKVNEYCETLASVGALPPHIALGLPFLALSLLIMWMYHILLRPGGQPIGYIERFFNKLLRRIRTLFRKLTRANARTNAGARQ